jgi:hypothetical protein
VFGDKAAGDTITAPGDTIASLFRMLSGIPMGHQPILAVSASGDSLRGEGIFGDYNIVDVSFARRRICVTAMWDVPRADPNVPCSRVD